jgi:hypothetical protein
VLFVIVHVVQVFVAGAFNGMRSMVTGRHVVRPELVCPELMRPEGSA